MARVLGVRSPLAANLSLALGSSGVSLKEMTAVYAVFGNSGRTVRPVCVKRIIDRHGRVLEENRPKTGQLVNARTAFQVTHLLEDVIKEGTGKAARGLKVAAAGKTGTTDQNVDAWFIGYTPDLVAGVWVGFDKKRTLGRGRPAVGQRRRSGGISWAGPDGIPSRAVSRSRRALSLLRSARRRIRLRGQSATRRARWSRF